MGFFEKNLSALKESDPLLAEALQRTGTRGFLRSEPAANGLPTLKVGGVAIHSLRDPVKEGEQWAARVAAQRGLKRSGRATVLGFGLGYHLKSLAAMGVAGAVIEPDPAMLACAMDSLDLTDVLSSFRIIQGVQKEALRRAHRDLLLDPILQHPSSVRLHPDYLGPLQSFAEGVKAARGGGIKILLVNPIYGGSLPVARYCASALRSMGHIVSVFEAEAFGAGLGFAENYRFDRCRRAFRNELTAMVSRSVELMAKETRPDLILALAQAPLVGDSLKRLAAMDISTAFWFVEDYRVLTYWQEVAPHYRYFFGIQKENFAKELAAIGVSGYKYLPMAAAPAIHAPMELSREETEEYGSPVSFVGAGYYNRCQLFRGLTDYPFRIWGSDWPMTPPLDRLIQRKSARIDTEDCVRIFNASKVNINLHSSLSHEGVVPDGDFVNPRTFEIASCGAFQLVDRRSLLGELFTDNELERFSDLGELRDKIDHYLDNVEGREGLARRGRERVLAEHTYMMRMEELLATVIAENAGLAERLCQRREELADLHGRIDGQEGLRGLLDRLPGGRAPTLEGIYTALHSGEGDLSRAEKIFLALKHVELKLD
jgi:spore maturation protein CgeB